MINLERLLVAMMMAFTCGCESLIPEAPAEDSLLDGPVEGLFPEQQGQFLEGDIAFNDEVFSSETGLGPFFVATSCASCHVGDGKGHPFTTLTRFGQSAPGDNEFMGLGGPQLQNRALPGHAPETLPEGASFSRFTPPAVTGLGFLEALTDAQILENADPDDIDEDGISGRPNHIPPPEYFQPKSGNNPVRGQYLGRFGKKAAALDLLHQTVLAYKEDMGVTSEFEPLEPEIYNRADIAADAVPEPEVASSTVRNVVFYLQTLKAPIQRDQNDAQIMSGREIFLEIGCSDCHIPEWTTPYSEIAAISYKTFYPYTDMLLHDMGPDLDDGYTEGSAETYEWRTPPLWGLGLSKNSQGGEYFLMHDGRAKSIVDAIELHGGEADRSRVNFITLDPTEKVELLKFLESL